MNTRPIIFNGAMVRALLEGRKTETRRVIKDIETLTNGMITPKAGYSPRRPESHVSYCPYGQPGDLLWVRETWCTEVEGITRGFLYRADDEHVIHAEGAHRSPWRPSIHMPRWASRLTLRITNVRIDRVQEIGEEDAKAEGADPTGLNATMGGEHIAGFRLLWDSINAKRGFCWDTNPWVWVIEFEVIHANADEVIANMWAG